MRVMLRWVVPVLLVAAVVHVLAVILQRAGEAAGVNAPMHAPPITAAARRIPLPSPDLLYSTCALDLAAGPVLVSVTPGAAYLSLAVFDARTDNVFVTNDSQAGGKPITVLVAGPGQAAQLPQGARLARLGTMRGLLLLRGLAATPELARITDAARRTLSCRPWRGTAGLP